MSQEDYTFMFILVLYRVLLIERPPAPAPPTHPQSSSPVAARSIVKRDLDSSFPRLALHLRPPLPDHRQRAHHQGSARQLRLAANPGASSAKNLDDVPFPLPLPGHSLRRVSRVYSLLDGVGVFEEDGRVRTGPRPAPTPGLSAIALPAARGAAFTLASRCRGPEVRVGAALGVAATAVTVGRVATRLCAKRQPRPRRGEGRMGGG